MFKKQALTTVLILCIHLALAQNMDNIRTIIFSEGSPIDHFDLIDTEKKKAFVLAEHWHNIKGVPAATLSLLKFLHANGNTRVLAIEQGASVAFMINAYLQSGDTTMLQHITRNTMFWAKEHREFFKALYSFNAALPPKDRVIVKSIDIEYKMESAIFVINQLLQERDVPLPLQSTLGAFKELYEQSKEHRESFDGLAIMFYYDRDLIQQLIIKTINDLEANEKSYADFFGTDYEPFRSMIYDMDDGLAFDYTNPNTKYKFRDRIIQKKLTELAELHSNEGILCVIGMKHTYKGSSIYNLQHKPSSILFDQIVNIRISALYNNGINAGDLKKINFNFPQQLKKNPATLIKHDQTDPRLRTNKWFDYTIFINENGSLTAFDNILTEEY